MNTQFSRREFLQAAGALAAVKWDQASAAQPGPICLFSKHLPMLSWEQLAEAVKQAGFDGVDLTVRPGGHVLPAKAAEDLPRAARAIRERGLALPMITTALTAASEPTANPIISTAGKLSIPFFKAGYYKYSYLDMRREMEQAMSDFGSLAALGSRHGIAAGFHNHEGNLGGAIADISGAMEKLDAKWAGYYFDIRHAVCEGGSAGWKIAFHLAAPRMKMIAIKDFYWEKTGSGWKQVNCPLGEGMVDWKQFCRMLKQANFQGPVSLHLEYPIAGRTDNEKRDNTLIAARRDLAFLQARLKETYQP